MTKRVMKTERMKRIKWMKEMVSRTEKKAGPAGEDDDQPNCTAVIFQMQRWL